MNIFFKSVFPPDGKNSEDKTHVLSTLYYIILGKHSAWKIVCS